MHEERERLRVTLASIGDAVISTDAEGRIEFLNPIAEQLTGWMTSEASGLPLVGCFQNHQRANAAAGRESGSKLRSAKAALLGLPITRS